MGSHEAWAGKTDAAVALEVEALAGKGTGGLSSEEVAKIAAAKEWVRTNFLKKDAAGGWVYTIADLYAWESSSNKAVAEGAKAAIDVMVRGIKAGLPVSDALKVIANETPAPVGPEFSDVVEGQRLGVTIDQGLERMYERMPLAEVSFLAIVMAIQAKAGGNLAEALGNLSRVLRDRKKMKQKITSVSQEAKASAAIIGSLPFCIGGAMMVLNPTYLDPLFDTRIGNVLLIASGLWMSLGVLVMRKMINFDF